MTIREMKDQFVIVLEKNKELEAMIENLILHDAENKNEIELLKERLISLSV